MTVATGDLCEDTNPTPMNTDCNEPNVTENVCNIRAFTDTPYRNFMSYAGNKHYWTCYFRFTCYKGNIGIRYVPYPLCRWYMSR